MNRKGITIAALILAITLGGCNKKEEYPPTETPDRPPLENPGQVIVTPPEVPTADVTPLLAGFNTGVANQPAHLQAALSFGLSDIVGTITGWTPAPPQDLPGE